MSCDQLNTIKMFIPHDDGKMHNLLYDYVRSVIEPMFMLSMIIKGYMEVSGNYHLMVNQKNPIST